MTDPRMTPTNDAPVTVEQCVMVCPQCEGEGGYADGLDDAACHTDCTRCGGNGWIVDLTALASAPAGDGVIEQIADIIADHVSGPNIAEGHADAVSHRADQLAAAKAIAAALVRPRAAVGEQSRKAVLSVLDDAIDNAGDESELRMAKAIRYEILALQSPPAKVEG